MPGNRAPCAVLVLCGLPAAGKTFLSHLLLHHQQRLLDNREVHIHHHCYDDALNAALQTSGGSFSPEAWTDARQQNMAKLKLLLTGSCNPGCSTDSSDDLLPPSGGSQADRDCHASATDRPALIVVDDNMQYRSMRYKCLQLAREHSAAFLVVHINCPLQLALQRNAGREGPSRVPDESLRRMAEVMEPPDPQLHPWETPCLVLQAEALDQWNGSQVWTWIAASWGPGLVSRSSPEDEERIKGDRAANAENALHHVDICTRRMLSAFLSAAPRQHQAAWASQANAERRKLLLKLRSCWQQQQLKEEGQREAKMMMLDHFIVEFDQHLSSIQLAACQNSETLKHRNQV